MLTIPTDTTAESDTLMFGSKSEQYKKLAYWRLLFSGIGPQLPSSLCKIYCRCSNTISNFACQGCTKDLSMNRCKLIYNTNYSQARDCKRLLMILPCHYKRMPKSFFLAGEVSVMTFHLLCTGLMTITSWMLTGMWAIVHWLHRS